MLTKHGVNYEYLSDRLRYYAVLVDGKYYLTCAKFGIEAHSLDLDESATEQEIKKAASSVIRIAAEAVIREVSE